MNIVIFRPPGAGKCTQSKFIVNKFNLYQLSTGDLLRNEIKNKTPLGSKISSTINSGELVSDNFQDQVTQTLENIKGILDERKCGLKNIVKLTVYLTDLSKFNDLNMVFEDFWDKWFEGGELFYPSRSAIEVSKLPKDSQIEIEAIFKDVK